MNKYVYLGIFAFISVYGSPIAPAANAQKPVLERVVVTAQRIDSDEFGSYGARPHVTKRVSAELVLMPFSVISGTIDTTERRAELRAMFDRYVQEVGAATGFHLEAGDMDERFPIETAQVQDLWRHYGNTGSFGLVLLVDAKEGELFETVRERGEAFLDTIELVGRAQYDVEDEQYIGLRNAKRHRLDLLRAIDADLEELDSVFSASDIQLTGLESAVITRPVEAMTLELYIPYTVTLTKK